ncbi:DoxX family protein [Streptomyces broussonetiae]|uniref:DoxX family protein n=1 Tax=Streptomyces broussonetiae TaxID=2686304 RepID=A0A6I6MXI5_9ACTN|nr:DoxX family protein [Streptomyces broussonetiae]QHA04052.1 DoxX family protein [Streptomyces broussonetiae]
MSQATAPIGSTTSAASADPTGSHTGRTRPARVALRSVQVLLALFYGIASALPKLVAHSSAVESFDRIGWGSGAMYTIGALELAGAVALLIPLLQSVAAIALGALMVGAFIVQITVFNGQNAETPLILMVPLIVIAWARRRSTGELLRLVRRR